MCSMHRLLNPQTCGSAAHGREHFRTLPILLLHVEKMASLLTDTNWPRRGSVGTEYDELRGVDRPQQQQQTGVNFIIPEDKRAYDLFVTAQMMKTDFANFDELREKRKTSTTSSQSPPPWTSYTPETASTTPHPPLSTANNPPTPPSKP